MPIPVHRMLTLIAAAGMTWSCSNSSADREPLADEQLIRQWQLPGGLREISGLALTDDGRLLAVADEEAVVYEIDFAAGGLVKRFAFGRPALRGDFEGIAVTRADNLADDPARVILSLPARAQMVPVSRSVNTTRASADIVSWKALRHRKAGTPFCSHARIRTTRMTPLRIFRVQIVDGALAEISDVELEEKALARKIGHKRLRPTAIAIDAETGHRMLLDANHLALLTVAPDGSAIDAIILPGKRRHRQPEGIAITDDGRLLIADEGGDGRARLAVYRWTSGRLGPGTTTMNEAALIKGSTGHTMLFVHGGDFKPQAGEVLDLCVAAVEAGLKRDYPDCLERFQGVEKRIAYYGDLTNEFLTGLGRDYDEALDIGDRRNVLQALAAIDKRKNFGVHRYDRVPGKNRGRRICGNRFRPCAWQARSVQYGNCQLCIDLGEYWNRDSEFGAQSRERVRTAISEALASGNQVMLVTHGTGAVLAYDALWELSHAGAGTADDNGPKIDTWITTGAPLGDTLVRKRLLGARRKGRRQFPANVVSWYKPVRRGRLPEPRQYAGR